MLLFSLCASLGVLVGTVVGFAGALLAVPFLTLFLSPRVAVPAFTVLTLVSNFVVVYEARRHLYWNRVTLLTLAGVVGTLLGAWSLAHLPTGAIRIIVSVVTLGFGLLFLFKAPIRLIKGNSVEAALGLLSGWLGGCIAQSGPPVVFLALARGWAKDAFRANLMAYFFVLNIFAVLAYWRLHLITPASLKLSAAALCPALLMSALGLWIKDRVNESLFRVIVLIIVILVGLAGLIPH